MPRFLYVIRYLDHEDIDDCIVGIYTDQERAAQDCQYFNDYQNFYKYRVEEIPVIK